MLFSACLSLIASFVLSVDAVRLAADPQRQPVLQHQRGDQLRHGRQLLAGAACSASPTRSSGWSPNRS